MRIGISPLRLASINIMKERVLADIMDIGITRQIKVGIELGRWIFSFPPAMDTIMPNGITIATSEPWIMLMIII
jgi:hypothetical protein